LPSIRGTSENEALFQANTDLLRLFCNAFSACENFLQVVEMYRRILFIAVLPLLGTGPVRASVGCFFSILTVALSRESSPFIRDSTNLLLVVSQYQLLGTFLAALVLASDSLRSFGLENFALGALLLVLNLVILALSGYWCVERWRTEQTQRQWRRALSSQEFALVQKFMNEQTTSFTELFANIGALSLSGDVDETHDDGADGKNAGGDSEPDSCPCVTFQEGLAKILFPSSEVELFKRVR
jgi:hypothetical protein